MKYEKPSLELVVLKLSDVVTISPQPEGSGPDVSGDEENGGWNS